MAEDTQEIRQQIQVGPISGFPEWTPNVRYQEERFLNIIREQYQLFGFTPIETPAVERFDVLTSKGGMQRQIYTVGRPEEGKDDAIEMGLHFDLTVPLARYVAQRSNDLTFPFRRYQIQKVWRGERAARGRFREFYQCDVDIIGNGTLDVIHDAELPCVINSTFEALGLPDFRVRVSNRKVLGDLLNRKVGNKDQLTNVLRAIDKTDRDGLEATRAELGREGISEEVIPVILDFIQCKDVKDARTILEQNDCDMQGIDELQTVMETAVDLGMPAERLVPDFSIARGLDYYTGTIYETFLVGKEDWGSICSGGRYEDLAACFTQQKYPGVGVSIGLTRLFNLLVENDMVDVSRKVPTEVLVTMLDRNTFMKEYLQIAALLRENGISTQAYLEPGRLKKQLTYANRCGIPLAVIAGETEIQEGKVNVKDLRDSGDQETIARDDLIEYVQKKLK